MDAENRPSPGQTYKFSTFLHACQVMGECEGRCCVQERNPGSVYWTLVPRPALDLKPDICHGYTIDALA